MTTCLRWCSSTVVRTALQSLIIIIIFVSGDVEAQQWRSSYIETDNSNTWGLPDATAPVGKLFEYRLHRGPNGEVETTAEEVGDDGSGEVTNAEKATEWAVYQINGFGDRVKLPEWLMFDAESAKLYGVADYGSIGRQYHIVVVFSGELFNNQASSKDEFSLRVIDDSSSSWSDSSRSSSRGPPSTSRRQLPSVRCPYGMSLTTATVVLDINLLQLSAADRVQLLLDFSRHFRLPASVFRLRPPPTDRPLLDLNSALAAGAGDLGAGALPQHDGLLVQWDVGCGNVRAELMPSLELLETSAADGRLKKALVGHPPIVGWHIAKTTRGSGSSGSLHRAPKHAPRYVAPTATPALPIAIQPTARTDIITVTVQTPASTSAATPATTNVVIVPTATVTEPSTTVTWSMTTEPLGDEITVFDNEFVVTTVETQSTAGRRQTAPLTTTSRRSIAGKVTTKSDDITTTATQAASTTQTQTASRIVDILQPSVTTLEPSTSNRRVVATTALPSTTVTARIVTAASKQTKRPTKPPTSRPMKPQNYAPEIRRPIGRLQVTAGKMLWYPIPNDTFVDREDGGTHNLHIVMQTTDGLELAPMSWIKVNTTSKTVFGLPMESDVGRHQYIMAAIDTEGRLAKNAFEVIVESGPSTARISHEISVVLDVEYQEFYFKGVERRLEVASRIAAAFGDSDPSHITVTSIRRGSVVYSWTNNTIPEGPPCPADSILDLSSRVIKISDGSLNPDFVAAMHPFPVQRAELHRHGACENDERLRVGGSKPGSMSPTPSDVEVEPKRVSSSVDTLLLIVVVAMVVVGILLMLLVILCIVCCCRARRRSEKQRRQRDDELSCANKGIPVIFADELDDDDDRKSSGTATMGRGNGNQTSPDDTPASTLKRRVRHADEEYQSPSSANVLAAAAAGSDDDDGRPAVPPPPEYPRSDPASRTSTLKSDYKAPLISDDDDSDDDMDNDKRRYGNGVDQGEDDGSTRPLYHPQPPNSNSLPPYKKL